MDKAICPNCEEHVEVKLDVEEETYNVRGEPIKIEAEVARCEKCGIKIFDDERDSRNLKKAYDKFRKNHNLLPPEEIRKLREDYGLSQRALSRLLGWGEITVHRYETGAIQDKAHDITLRLIADPQNIRKLLNENRSELPSPTAIRLERKLEEHLLEDKDETFQVYFERFVSHDRADLNSGFRKYDLEKFKNMVLHLVAKLDGVLKTKLNKLAWYCDFLSFKETSISITGTQYIHLPYGPVPDNYEFIIASMIYEGLLDKSEVVFDTSQEIVGECFTTSARPDDSIFTEEEIKFIDAVANTFREYTSTAITDRSHQETAYRECNAGDIISYKYAKELSLSLVQ